MSLHPKAEPIFSFEQLTFACLLVVGLYFPTSTNGEHSVLAIAIAFSILLGLLAYLIRRGGFRREGVAFISLPIVVLPVAFTFFRAMQRASGRRLGVACQIRRSRVRSGAGPPEVSCGSARERGLCAGESTEPRWTWALQYSWEVNGLAEFLPRYYSDCSRRTGSFDGRPTLSPCSRSEHTLWRDVLSICSSG